MSEQITTHTADALARFVEQYRDKPNLAAFLSVLTDRVQGVEDVLWQLASERFIDTAVGVQLDIIGKIVGQPRGNSADDDAYRLRLRARMRANQSSGTVNQILAVFLALGESPSDLRLEQFFPAGLVLHLEDEALSDADAVLYAEFLKAARAAAVDAQFNYSTVSGAATFTLPLETELTANFLEAGGVYETSMKVLSTTGFPDAGSVIARYTEDGGGEQIRFRYTSKTPTSFEGVTYAEGAVEDLLSGEMIISPPLPYTELSAAFNGPSFPADMPVKDASLFPDEGFVTLFYGTTVFTIFKYTSRTATELENISVHTGTHISFPINTLVVSHSATLGTDDPDADENFGGALSEVLGA